MEHIISISEVIEGAMPEEEEAELFATADASYDPSARAATVTLASFLRPVPGTEEDEARSVSWLPSARQVREHLTRDEVVPFTKDVFAHWVRTVRGAVPGHAPRR